MQRARPLCPHDGEASGPAPASHEVRLPPFNLGVPMKAIARTRLTMSDARFASEPEAECTTATVSPDTRPAQAPMPAPVNFDYAQPASFDTGASFYSGAAVPRYDVRHRYDPSTGNPVNGFGPYVLLTAPRPPQSVPNSAEAPQP